MSIIKSIFFVVIGLASIVGTPAFAAVGSYGPAVVTTIRSPDWRPCVFIQLKDVTNVDSTNSPWFTLNQSHIGYKEILSMTLSAKAAGKPITIGTTGSISQTCGGAEVYFIHLLPD